MSKMPSQLSSRIFRRQDRGPQLKAVINADDLVRPHTYLGYAVVLAHRARHGRVGYDIEFTSSAINIMHLTAKQPDHRLCQHSRPINLPPVAMSNSVLGRGV